MSARAGALLLGMALAFSCAPPEASADVVVEGLSPASIGSLVDPRVSLEVLDDEGRSARVRARDPDGREVMVTSPLPVPCSDGLCQLSLGLPAGTYTFALHVFAQDRCGKEARVVTLSSDGPLSLAPNQREVVDLRRTDFAFDDDGDGIENALELAVCGRVDVADEVWSPPRECAKASACCVGTDDGGPPVSDLVGRVTRFEGSEAHVRADGSTASVGPFFLDATEVPFGVLERCVAAGSCLFQEPSHPARVALRVPTLRRDLPVVGLSAREADELCAFLGKRLPTDDEWDFAAAFRGPGERARYPWTVGGSGALLDDGDPPSSLPLDELDDAPIGCWPTDSGTAANHRATGRSCPRTPLPVGSYGSSFARRGHGAPLADLAGNVYEWTTEPAGALPATAAPGFPERTARVYLRGGNHDAPPQLLENGLRLRVRPEDMERLAPVAGVRCARPIAHGEDVAAIEASLLPPMEPACAP